MSHRWILLAALLAACDGQTTEPDAGHTEGGTPPVEPTPEQKPPFQISQADLAAQAEQVTLVPSPAEMQQALEKAGLTSRLASMVQDRTLSTEAENLDQVAVRTGVVLAEVVLTVKESPKERFTARMGELKKGFALLKAGDDIGRTIDDIVERVNNDAVTREDLLKEVDELSGVMVPELESEAGDWVVPLVQAGSWLEGSYLVSGAIGNEAKATEAAGLLRQPAVVDYFLKYVQREGRDKAPDQVVKQLEDTLLKLKEITGKETLSEADVKDIHATTGAVLQLL